MSNRWKFRYRWIHGPVSIHVLGKEMVFKNGATQAWWEKGKDLIAFHFITERFFKDEELNRLEELGGKMLGEDLSGGVKT